MVGTKDKSNMYLSLGLSLALGLSLSLYKGAHNYLNIERRRLSSMKRKLSRWLKGEADPRVLTIET